MPCPFQLMCIFQQALSTFIQVSLTLAGKTTFLCTLIFPSSSPHLFNNRNLGSFPSPPFIAQSCPSTSTVVHKALSFWEQACLQDTSQPGCGSQGLDSGNVKFGDVSFSLATGSESKSTCPCPSCATWHTLFGAFSMHARVLRRVRQARAYSGMCRQGLDCHTGMTLCVFLCLGQTGTANSCLLDSSYYGRYVAV